MSGAKVNDRPIRYFFGEACHDFSLREQAKGRNTTQRRAGLPVRNRIGENGKSQRELQGRGVKHDTPHTNKGCRKGVIHNTQLAAVPLRIGVPRCLMCRYALGFFFERTEHILASNSIELSADSSGYGQAVPI